MDLGLISQSTLRLLTLPVLSPSHKRAFAAGHARLARHTAPHVDEETSPLWRATRSPVGQFPAGRPYTLATLPPPPVLPAALNARTATRARRAQQLRPAPYTTRCAAGSW